MRFTSTFIAPLALAATVNARFVMYYDEYVSNQYPSRLSG